MSFVNKMMRFCALTSLIVSRHAYAHMFLYLHVYILLCVCLVYNPWCHPYMLSCATQSWSSLSIHPGPVLVFRAPPEGPLAWWERCWRRPGPAALLPSPSTGCQAQRVPLASRAWQWGCLHSQCRVWTGQGAATSCWTHTCRKANLHDGTPTHTHTNKHLQAHTFPRGRLLEGLTHVQKILQKCERM